MFLLETQNCLLRELRESDAESMFRMDTDPLVMQFLGGVKVENVEKSQSIIRMVQEQYTTNGYGRWAVIEKETNTFMGWAGLKRVFGETYYPEPHTDLGYRLIPKFWGKGFATELALACRDWGFRVAGIEALYAATHQNNLASQRIIQKTGLSLEGTFEYEGAPQYWYSLSREKWEREATK